MSLVRTALLFSVPRFSFMVACSLCSNSSLV